MGVCTYKKEMYCMVSSSFMFDRNKKNKRVFLCFCTHEVRRDLSVGTYEKGWVCRAEEEEENKESLTQEFQV